MTFMIALTIAIPVILLPAALVWYLDMGELMAAVKEIRTRRATHAKGVR